MLWEWMQRTSCRCVVPRAHQGRCGAKSLWEWTGCGILLAAALRARISFSRREFGFVLIVRWEGKSVPSALVAAVDLCVEFHANFRHLFRQGEGSGSTSYPEKLFVACQCRLSQWRRQELRAALSEVDAEFRTFCEGRQSCPIVIGTHRYVWPTSWSLRMRFIMFTMIAVMCCEVACGFAELRRREILGFSLARSHLGTLIWEQTKVQV